MIGVTSGRVTPHGIALLVVTAWVASLAVVSARPELWLAALPLALALALGAVRHAAPRYLVSRAIASDRLNEGDRFSVTITVSAETAVPLVEVLDAVPPGCRVVSGRPRAVLALRRGETASFDYEVAGARGLHDFGLATSRARDRWGVRAWERSHAEPAAVRVFPRLAPLRSVPRPLHTQTSVGDHVSPALGEGIEPGDIREFVIGDRIREVNWRASLRLGALYVTRHPRERNADIVLMLDTLAQVGEPNEGTLDHAARAAASLAAAYLARKDRVGLISYGGTIDWVRPGSGRAQYERLADVLLRAAVVFTYVSKDLAFIPRRVLPPHALIVAITPLLDPRFSKAALDLVARGFDLVVIAVSPVDVTRAMLRGTPVDRLACRLWALERRERLDEFRRHGVAVLEWNPADPLEGTLAGHARRRPRPVIVG